MEDKDLRDRLKEALDECARLSAENERLRNIIGSLNLDYTQPPEPSIMKQSSLASESGSDSAKIVSSSSTAERKVALFRDLFRGRDDVYAVRWESRSGKAGYSPACRNEWNRSFCKKPQVKCSHCEYRELVPLSDEVIVDHLRGKCTIGIYPLMTDESCQVLIVDFDKASWQEDALAFMLTCEEMDIPVALERSRSGNGGHVWIFFEHPVKAATVRKLGCAILSRTMDRHRFIGLDSYDRLFPSQDTLPKGGFGNLIALPLQRSPRDDGNSVFLDSSQQPYPDQWAFLSKVRKLTEIEVEAMVEIIADEEGIMGGIRLSLAADDIEPWTLPPSGKRQEFLITQPMPKTIKIVSGNLLYIEKKKLPNTMINRLIRIAAFENPEFYRAQAMRLPTYDKPRVINCAQEFTKHIGLPRGCLDEALALFDLCKITVKIEDERFFGVPIDVEFAGNLKPEQEDAVRALQAHDIGILSATTAFGKTVVGSWIIAARKVNTLVLVHRRQLMDQWIGQLESFLDLSAKSIGQIGGGKIKPSGKIDVAVIQSLYRKGKVKDLVADYGQIIVDECHHISAFSFEAVLKQAKARYVVGLTATPIRKDGHHPIIMMQCGPIRFHVDAKKQAHERPFSHAVIKRCTGFQYTSGEDSPRIQDIYSDLVDDNERNQMIIKDVVKAIKDGRSPLILTERTAHLELLADKFQSVVQNVVVLRGGMGANQRRNIAAWISNIPSKDERVLIATGRYAGEGFDDDRLDTLFLTMPVSWKGTLAQYAGRLHRLHEEKQEVQVYDYVDDNVSVLRRMFEKRTKGYRAIGYTIRELP